MKIVLGLALAFFVSVGSASAGETYLLSQTLGGVMAVEPVASSSDVVADCGSCRGVVARQPVRSCLRSVVSRKPVRSCVRRVLSVRPFARLRCCR